MMHLPDISDNSHNVNIVEFSICFIFSQWLLHIISLGKILESLGALLLLIITLFINDFYKEYLKPKIFKFINKKKSK